MEVYLVQHGEAKSEAEDPQRPLSDRGRGEVELIARQISRAGIRTSPPSKQSCLTAFRRAGEGGG